MTILTILKLTTIQVDSSFAIHLNSADAKVEYKKIEEVQKGAELFDTNKIQVKTVNREGQADVVFDDGIIRMDH